MYTLSFMKDCTEIILAGMPRAIDILGRTLIWTILFRITLPIQCFFRDFHHQAIRSMVRYYHRWRDRKYM